MRSFRRANRLAENAQAEVREDSRRLSAHFDVDGMLVLRGRLTPEQGALVLKALEVSADELRAWSSNGASAREAAEPSRANGRDSAEPPRANGHDSAEPPRASSPASEADGQQLLAEVLIL